MLILTNKRHYFFVFVFPLINHVSILDQTGTGARGCQSHVSHSAAIEGGF